VLWRTYGDCENYGVLSGHRGAILDLQWSRDSDIVFSASADTHLASWDLTSGERIRRYVGHEEIVNTMDISKRGEELLISGSDDGTIGIWDPRTKHAADYIETEFPITAVAISEAGNEIYSGGIDNDIKVWDIRKKALVHSMLGHNDTVTSLRVSPDGQQLLSYAMDSTARTWDIRPFAPAERHIRTFDGAPLGLEKNMIRGSWDSDGKKIAVGAGDGTVVVWGSDTGKLLYKLPGHKGTVNCAEFAPGGAPISGFPCLWRVCAVLTRHQFFPRLLTRRCCWASLSELITRQRLEDYSVFLNREDSREVSGSQNTATASRGATATSYSKGKERSRTAVPSHPAECSSLRSRGRLGIAAADMMASQDRGQEPKKARNDGDQRRTREVGSESAASKSCGNDTLPS
jgi:Prp8 binding protein